MNLLLVSMCIFVIPHSTGMEGIITAEQHKNWNKGAENSSVGEREREKKGPSPIVEAIFLISCAALFPKLDVS